ncbi:OmpA family protein [Streptomyces sp. TRM68367]|uniref:OmpA family protein n=1 Tax=Streptomyces sp. TRM68367 TaxID=2758415 RepID=UPI00165BE695|nr:OmpA family protein [Streptomyces sp. TRM68367]MBC9728351.1 OmpA family protein [Streptomyces sp. TRM68367]
MTVTQAPARARNVRLALTFTATAVIVATNLYGTGPAHAADGPSVPPGTEATATAPVEVDRNDPDLKLPEGATLATPKVLDIKSVVEDQTGDERREDTNTNVKFALQAEVLFSKDSAKLSAESRARISGIAEEIKTQNATRIRVFGFTDDLGSSAHGDVLSKRRANAVQEVLDQELNDSAITYEVRGYGEQYPIADNSTEAGRKKNRRVEVSFPRSESGQATG